METHFTGAGGHRLSPCCHSSSASQARRGCTALTTGSHCSSEAHADRCSGLASWTRCIPLLPVFCTRSSEWAPSTAFRMSVPENKCSVCNQTLTPPSEFSASAGNNGISRPFFFSPKGEYVEVGDNSKNRAGCPAPRIWCRFQHWITYKLIDEGRLHTTFSKEFALKC